MRDFFDKGIEYVLELLGRLTDLGPIGGILLTMIEAFFPPLPLVLFVTINVAAFGFWWGYLYSVIGTIIGNIIMFYLIKAAGRKFIYRYLEKRPKLNVIFIWIHSKGFTPIFILLTFPFTPSIVVCALAALGDVKNDHYIMATILGKMIMVLSLSFIGYNITAFFEHPIRSAALIVVTILTTFIGKNLIARYEKFLEKRHLEANHKHGILPKK